MSIDPNDKLYALQWAVNKAQQEPPGDPLLQLNLAILTELRDQARQEARA